MVFINQSGTVGIIYASFTQNVTGSEFLTLMGLIIMIILFFMVFKLPLEATIILVMPILLIAVAYSPDIFAVVGVLIMYLAMIFAKNYIGKS